MFLHRNTIESEALSALHHKKLKANKVMQKIFGFCLVDYQEKFETWRWNTDANNSNSLNFRGNYT